MAKRRCFILGAGFSKPYGLPLARELTPIVWRAMARADLTNKAANAPLSQSGDFGHEVIETNLKAIRLLFPSFACVAECPNTWPDFEELITALDEADRYRQSFQELTTAEADGWAGHTKHWLMHYLEERLSDLTEAAVKGGLESVRQFVGSLDLEADSIISFNWDVLLEIAADELGITVRYNNDLEPGLRLAKPHGSLNLVDTPRQKIDEVQKAGLDEEVEYNKGGERHVVARARNPKQAWIRQAWAPQEFKVLVEPNIRKTYDTLWLKLQWVRALNMVRRADEIVVIGFSLPAADLRPRILLQLAQLDRNPAPALLIIDPRATALCKHYRRLTGFSPQPLADSLAEFLTGVDRRRSWRSRVCKWKRTCLG